MISQSDGPRGADESKIPLRRLEAVDVEEKLERIIGDSDLILFFIVATHPPAFLQSVIVFLISAMESSTVLSTPTRRLY